MDQILVKTQPVQKFKLDTIGRQLLFTTAYIEHEVSPGMVISGTSFFYDACLSTPAESPRRTPVLVTNKHVIRGATRGIIRLFRKAETGEPLLGSCVNLSFTEQDFVGHPDPDVDVAACLLGPAANSLKAAGTPVVIHLVGRDLLPSKEVLDELDVVEPVTFVGYPNALYDSTNLTPIVRRGTTATPIQLDYCGTPQFLIDASIFPGSSGSPVFLFYEGAFRAEGGWAAGTRLLFLGIVAAVHQQAGTGRIVTSASPTIQFDQMIDLGLVFKSAAIEETIDELCRQRGVSRQGSTALVQSAIG